MICNVYKILRNVYKILRNVSQQNKTELHACSCLFWMSPLTPVRCAWLELGSTTVLILFGCHIGGPGLAWSLLLHFYQGLFWRKNRNVISPVPPSTATCFPYPSDDRPSRGRTTRTATHHQPWCDSGR